MQFCPKCGALLVKKTKNMGCPRCNYASKEKANINTSEKIECQKEVAVIKEKQADVHPIVTNECKKCSNEKAYFWTVQTRASDEAETKFFKCTKCNHTDRDYS